MRPVSSGSKGAGLEVRTLIPESSAVGEVDLSFAHAAAVRTKESAAIRASAERGTVRAVDRLVDEASGFVAGRGMPIGVPNGVRRYTSGHLM